MRQPTERGRGHFWPAPHLIGKNQGFRNCLPTFFSVSGGMIRGIWIAQNFVEGFNYTFLGTIGQKSSPNTPFKSFWQVVGKSLKFNKDQFLKKIWIQTFLKVSDAAAGSQIYSEWKNYIRIIYTIINPYPNAKLYKSTIDSSKVGDTKKL